MEYTNKELIESFSESIGILKNIRHGSVLDAVPKEYIKQTIDQLKQTVDIMQGLEKHRWHDLRENPEDLPEDGESVFMVCDLIGAKGWNSVVRRIYIAKHGTIYAPESLSGHKEILKQGWHFAGKDLKFVDQNRMKVIAWKRIEPFEK